MQYISYWGCYYIGKLNLYIYCVVFSSYCVYSRCLDIRLYREKKPCFIIIVISTCIDYKKWGIMAARVGNDRPLVIVFKYLAYNGFSYSLMMRGK